MPLDTNSIILFQGDSITDAGRNREDQKPNSGFGFGVGYPYFISSMLQLDFPDRKLQFFNRGNSGNRIVDLYARMREDIINLHPNLLSILIGVNDTWHRFLYSSGVAVPKFDRVYRQLLDEVLSDVPNLKLVICEPFVLPCGTVQDAWLAEMRSRREVVRQIAHDYKAVFVPFQKMFDDAVKLAPPTYWAEDGVHPTPAGHMLMARTWIKAVVG